MGGRVIENHGVVDWEGGDIALYQSGTGIENSAEFNANSYGSITGSGSSGFRNLQGGHFLASASNIQSSVDVPFLNEGTVEAGAGTLNLRAGSGGVSTGTYVAQPGDTTGFNGGVHTLWAG